MLWIKNTANEYFEKNSTRGYALTVFFLEHNSKSANDPSNTNGNSYHNAKS